MTMTQLAITYDSGTYALKPGQKVFGRMSANRTFLQALLKYGPEAGLEGLVAYSALQQGVDHLKDVAEECQSLLKIAGVLKSETERLVETGILFKPDPVLAPLGWVRRSVGEHLYSLCGIAHTVSGKEIMEDICRYGVTPIEPWDGLICTSLSVRAAITRMLDAQEAFLAEHLGVSGLTMKRPQLPVLPLGVDLDDFEDPASLQAAEHRQRFRDQLGIGPDEVAILYFGRLCFDNKMHPIPMFQAVELAAGRVGCKLHFIQVGWYPSKWDERAYRKAFKAFMPSVTVHELSGVDEDVRRHIWFAGDVFLSLSDNVQESFGITPIEAMATGLPVVVADWDGYRDSVEDGVQGFRVPSVTAAPGHGEDLAIKYLNNGFTFHEMMGQIANTVAVSVPATADRLQCLIESPALRQEMGRDGRARVTAVYSWRRLLPSYVAFWQSLSAARRSATSVPKGAGSMRRGAVVPHCQDLYRVFQSYPSMPLPWTEPLELTGVPLALVRKDKMAFFGADERLSNRLTNLLVKHLHQGPKTATDLYAVIRAKVPAHINDAKLTAVFVRTLLHLLKFNIVA